MISKNWRSWGVRRFGKNYRTLTFHEIMLTLENTKKCTDEFFDNTGDIWQKLCYNQGILKMR